MPLQFFLTSFLHSGPIYLVEHHALEKLAILVFSRQNRTPFQSQEIERREREREREMKLKWLFSMVVIPFTKELCLSQCLLCIYQCIYLFVCLSIHLPTCLSVSCQPAIQSTNQLNKHLLTHSPIHPLTQLATH